MDPRILCTPLPSRSSKRPEVGRSPITGKVYRTTELGSHLSRGFLALWQNKQLFDCTIEVGDACFDLHKGVLIALSPYFQSMFTSGFLEAGKSRVELKGISAAGFQAVSTFLYTSEIHICEDTLQAIMEAAAHLQIPAVLDFCAQFMCASISTSNCFDFLRLAHMYDHVTSLDITQEFLARNCHVLVESGELLQLPAAVLAAVLAKDELPFRAELDVLRLARCWLAANLGASMHDILQVFRCVRYALMPADDVTACLAGCWLAEDARFQALLRQARGYVDDLVNIPNHVPKAQYRTSHQTSTAIFQVHYSMSDEATSLAKGRCSLARLHGDLHTYDVLDSLPGRVIFKSSALLALGGGRYVIVTGGEMEPPPMHVFHASAKCHRFDFLSRRWVGIADMQEARAMHASAALNDTSLVVVGGLGRNDDMPWKILASVEIYDLASNTWRRAHDFPYGIRSAQACTLQGNVYVAGGTSSVQTVVDVNSHRLHVYDREQDRWLERSSMNCKKLCHVLLAVGDKLYAYGAYRQEMQLLYDMPWEPVEVYCPATNQWTMLTPPLTVRNSLLQDLVGGFVMRNSVFLLARSRLVELNTDTGAWRVWDANAQSVVLVTAVCVPSSAGEVDLEAAPPPYRADEQVRIEPQPLAALAAWAGQDHLAPGL